MSEKHEVVVTFDMRSDWIAISNGLENIAACDSAGSGFGKRDMQFLFSNEHDAYVSAGRIESVLREAGGLSYELRIISEKRTDRLFSLKSGALTADN
jgi:Mg-chelatase subunit ChlD